MRISVERTGGVLGRHWRARATDEELTVEEDGRERVQHLTASQRDRLRRLIEAAVKAPPARRPRFQDAPDAMRLRLEIRDGDRHRSFRLDSGAEATDDIWDLVGAVSEMAAPPDL